MRLLNVHTRTFTLFYSSPPAYVIASHRWIGDTEISFQDVEKQRNTHKEGFKKLVGFVEYAKTHIPHVEWLWIDTCCINKKDAAELSFAINSMYKWYKNAEVCLAYLADVNNSEDEDELGQSKWFDRGWTLQELIVPKIVVFLTRDWEVIGHKGARTIEDWSTLTPIGRSLVPLIARRTGVPEAVLEDPSRLEDFGKEERLEWVASRSTTREEDMWYCLFGILNVAIGANYGEGTDRARRRLLAEVGLTETAHAQPQPSSSVPFRRDTDYIERPGLMGQLIARLSQLAGRAALVGLGGVGKSQLAIEYCYRVREKWPETWVLWLHASSAARFDASIRKLADDVKIDGRKAPNADIYQLVYDWLRDARNGKWVVVLDNADEAEFLLLAPVADAEEGSRGNRTFARRARIEYLPICEHGSVLITSRYRTMAEKLMDDYDIIAVHPMASENAVELLRRKIGQPTSKAGLEKLVATLEYMPLAITQAAAYIQRRWPRYSVEQYLAKFEESERSRASLLAMDAGELRRDWEAANSVLVTWLISFEHVAQSTPSAAKLLSLMSFFDCQEIPEYVLQAAADDGLADRRTGQEFDADILILCEHHLISIAPSGKAFAMHRLVQLAARKWLELKGQYQRWARQSMQKLDSVHPNGEYANWGRCGELSSHARLTLEVRVEERQARLWRASILYKAAWFAWAQGRAAEAQVLAEACVQERTSVLGRENEKTLSGEAMLGLVLKYQGKYETAEEINRRALEGMEKALGAEHPSTLTSVNNLAIVLENQGKYKAAEEMNRRALKGSEKALGAEHPDTLISANNLAGVLESQGKYKAAEEMNWRALEGSEKALGAEHPSTLITVNNLALVLKSRGKYKAAEELNRRALEGSEKALGAEHPDTLISANNLAGVLESQGKYKAAEEMNRRALEGREKALGAEHLDTLTSVSILARVLESQGKYKAAEEMNRRALNGREKALGAEHPSTLTSVNNLAIVLENQGKYKAAEEMNRRALAGYKKALGAEHPSTLTSVSNLAGVLDSQGKYKAAEEMNRRALEGYTKALGAEHPYTLTSANNLAGVLKSQGKYKAAEEMNRRALEGREKALGAEHPSTLTSVYCLALLLQKINDCDTALELYYRAYAGCLKTLGQSHPTTVKCFNHMSSLQRGMRSIGQDVKARTIPNTSVVAEGVSKPVNSLSARIRNGVADQQPRER